jgi:hypothetical protein
VNGAGYELFSSAGFALDQHSGIGRCHDLDLPQHALQRHTSPHDLLEVQFAAKLLFETHPLFAKTVFQFSQFPVDDIFLNRNRNVARSLRQEINFVLGVGRVLALADCQEAQDLVPAREGQDADILEAD